MVYFARDFANVDGMRAVDKLVSCLDLQCSLQFYQDYKQKTFSCLQLFEGAYILEVGCGTGEDAIAIAPQVGITGKVIAVDRSQSMIERAKARVSGLNLSIEFLCADARQLPFEDNTFDGARVDRTLQHIDDPQKALSEMARVVRLGGSIVAMEPDWETFTVNSDNREITRRLLNFWCDSFPSGWIGRNLTKYFQQAGLTEIQVSPETFVTTDFELADRIFDLVRTTDGAKEAGKMSLQEANDWLDELRSLERAGMFFCSFTAMIVNGKK
jgi:ubiquinone/menaquinone biosynthesis C-methylase UbiE